MKKTVFVAILFTATTQQPVSAEGFYLSGKAAFAKQDADSMETSLRPRIGDFVEIDNSDHFNRGAIALGYMFDNWWQVEVEYNSKVDTEYRSGSTRFANSFNNYQISSEKLMLNAYRSLPVYSIISVYGHAGLGLAKIKVGGWQGIESRQYYSNSQTNLAYALGAGMRVDITKGIFADLGYRYSGLGKVESGMNSFDNNYGNTLRDEQLKADLSEQELYLGLSYTF
ncbi:outer membrane protein [Aeromonas veronii]|uniref:outer membrane protein n=1 Tax=Aeromonas veronii TaxID=654 RepID=UPI0010129DF9|nr:outer membrane beta-barrel protein [Aeromonas veronii]